MQNLSDLILSLNAAVEAAPPVGSRLAHARDLLSAEQVNLQANAALFQEGDRSPLLQQASSIRLLARSMDGYTSEAEGEMAQAIVTHQRLLVLTAWQITAVASGSEAAGL